MPLSDFIFVTKWWFFLFIIGIVFFPLTSLIFSRFLDKGYVFSKTLGIIAISYLVFLLGIARVLKFTSPTVYLVFLLFLLINIIIVKTKFKGINIKKIISFNITNKKQENFLEKFKSRHFKNSYKKEFPKEDENVKKIRRLIKIIFFEELIFFLALLFWSFIKAHQPEIHGLEKFMDFGFINSILRSDYFPPPDMWFSPFPINYYYFGHLTTAVLTKFSGISSNITYNLMLASIFAFALSSSFSILLNLLSKNFNEIRKNMVFGALLGGLLLTLSGNLHTIYSFFTAYPNESPVAFWTLNFSPLNFSNNYWYPNATRFIPFTIHEFPLYSFVVSDLHGHVIDIPFVLFSIALIYSIYIDGYIKNAKLLLLSFLLAVMYMTNAWDGIIYFLLTLIIIIFLTVRKISPGFIGKIPNLILNFNSPFYDIVKNVFILFLGYLIFSFPFSMNFKPFVSGVGVVCAPDFLIKMGKFGPFLFEANHCQRSPWWQLLILYGFFYFFVFSFIIFILKRKNTNKNSSVDLDSIGGDRGNTQKTSNFENLKKLKFIEHLNKSDIFIFLLILISTLLIIIPEFIYIKDIYPAHYRANTMFKLVYQAFMILSLVVSYAITRIFRESRNFLFYLLSIILLFLVFIYPYFAVNSYFGDLKKYSALDGTAYIKNLYPQDYKAVNWINENIKGQPVILEAQGDSYTDYGRISANTGLPTILGWTVHEWLWRGTYDIPAPRIEEVKNIYESNDVSTTADLLKKYDVVYVYIGQLERGKYPNLNEKKFQQLGNIIYQNEAVKIYKLKS